VSNRNRSLAAAALLAPLAVSCGDGGTTETCTGPNGPCIEIAAGADAYGRIQEAMITALPGDVIHLGPGTYDMPLDLTLQIDGVTVRGSGMDQTILTFANQIEGAQGILVTGDDVTFEDLAVEDSRGDLLKFEGSTGVTIRRVRAEWTRGADTGNGAYGLYPVQCENVLIEDCVVRGASDAGVYVGQSKNIIVRRNFVTENVAGIEIENSQDADVYENEATGNTGGILIFNLPGLPVKDGRRARVFNNDIHDNNEPNFAPAGNIVGKIPQGTGCAVFAVRDIEFFGNTVSNNQTSQLAVVSYFLSGLTWDDPDYSPYPETIYAHDNTFVGGGNMPSEGLGFLLVQALVDVLGAPVTVPDMIIDGYRDPAHTGADGELTPEFRFCAQRNGDATFADLDLDNDHVNVVLELGAAHDCSHPPLEPVVIPGVQ
jgi:parallel beta-helix repeat protein